MQWIAIAVRNNTPNKLSFSFGLWTLRLIGQLIERHFGMTLSLPTLSKVMNQLGFTPQRPPHRSMDPSDRTPRTDDRVRVRVTAVDVPKRRVAVAWL